MSTRMMITCLFIAALLGMGVAIAYSVIHNDGVPAFFGVVVGGLVTLICVVCSFDSEEESDE
jgi:uncharacterized BrkB/YihY/UPF0761 family membrane protein